MLFKVCCVCVCVYILCTQLSEREAAYLTIHLMMEHTIECSHSWQNSSKFQADFMIQGPGSNLIPETKTDDFQAPGNYS